MSKTDTSLGSTKRKHYDTITSPSSSNNGITDDGRGNQAPRSNEHHHQGGYYYAHTHQHHTNDAASSNKRRRQKEDLRYAAATIQQSLSDAGHHDARDMSSILQNRRERALPMGSVDMSTVKLLTSTKFDSEMSDGEECLVVDEEEQSDVIYGQSKADTNSSDDDQEEEYNDVSEMYMLSNLIQSTRQYYNFSSDDTKTTQATASLPTSHPTTMNNKNFTNNHEQSLPRSDSSEGLSSYTPLSSENDLNHDDDDGDDKKKDIDNDNRSDGQSSDMDDTSASSSTSTSEGETSSGDGVVKEDSLGCIN